MSVVLTNSEFFTYNNEVWVRLSDGTMKALKDSDRDVIAAILDCVSTFYPKAYAALSKEYEAAPRINHIIATEWLCASYAATLPRSTISRTSTKICTAISNMSIALFAASAE